MLSFCKAFSWFVIQINIHIVVSGKSDDAIDLNSELT